VCVFILRVCVYNLFVFRLSRCICSLIEAKLNKTKQHQQNKKTKETKHD
jgi:hypothetical protein